MKLHAPKLLGLAAITLALGAIATVGTSQACEKSAKAEQAKATASTESGCAASKAAMTASAKSTSKTHKASYAAGSSCNYPTATAAKYAASDACCFEDCCDVSAARAVLASGATGCEARKAQMVLADAKILEAHEAHAVHATHAVHEAHGAHAEHATALASADGCAGKAKTSAALASSDGCASSKAKTSTALASAEGCESHKAKTSSAALASADGCAAHKGAAMADAKSGCTMEKSAAFASACARYEACSVKADLAHAKDADLDLYEKEKKQDGVAISGVKLPAFYATDLQGNKVSSKDLKGTPTVLVLLATHCGHSYQTLPILTAAAEEFGPRGLRVVGLVVGSSPEKAKGWFEGETTHEVWVTEDLTVADQLKSHLVPTYVLVDAKGNVKTKLVGFKKDAEVKENIPVLLVQAGAKESSKS